MKKMGVKNVEFGEGDAKESNAKEYRFGSAEVLLRRYFFRQTIIFGRF